MNPRQRVGRTPTPAEIKAETAKIRAGWSEYELLTRGRADEAGVDGPRIREVAVPFGNRHLMSE